MKKLGKIIGTGLLWLTFGFGAMLVVAQGLEIKHTAWTSPDKSTNWGVPYALENLNTIIQTNMLSKVIVNNNASTNYQIPNSTAYVLFTGVQSSVAGTISLPASANSLDGQEVSIFSASTAASAVSIASSGASVVGAPTTLAANETIKFKYDSGTNAWYLVGH